MGNASNHASSRGTPAVHPHVHGERCQPVIQPFGAFGSSPRTWGTLRSPPRLKLNRRFIPTYMGNAFSSPSSAAFMTVHPHVHGERLFRGLKLYQGLGSSPRTWGTPWRTWSITLTDRFIPTYMGNADRSSTHTCSATGSSPRTWGTRRTSTSRVYGAQVHPHVHGERTRANAAILF